MQQAIQKSRSKKLVPNDKFDKHFKRARRITLENRKHIFVMQSALSEETAERRLKLVGSIY